MHADELSARVRTFILAYIGSLEHIELLLFLRSHAERAWTPADAAQGMRSSPDSVASRMAHFATNGILEISSPNGVEPAYRYNPNSPDLVAAIDEVAKAYAERRVSVINLIFSKPLERIQVFADAFRLKKDDRDG